MASTKATQDDNAFNIPFLTPNAIGSSSSMGPPPIGAHASPISRSIGQIVIRPDEMDFVSDLTRLYFSTVHCKSNVSDIYPWSSVSSSLG